jgi:hypothetical protein
MNITLDEQEYRLVLFVSKYTVVGFRKHPMARITTSLLSLSSSMMQYHADYWKDTRLYKDISYFSARGWFNINTITWDKEDGWRSWL